MCIFLSCVLTIAIPVWKKYVARHCVTFTRGTYHRLIFNEHATENAIVEFEWFCEIDIKWAGRVRVVGEVPSSGHTFAVTGRYVTDPGRFRNSFTTAAQQVHRTGQIISNTNLPHSTELSKFLQCIYQEYIIHSNAKVSTNLWIFY